MEKKQILSIVSNNLRNLMNKQGVSISDLARRCDMSTGTISKIIAGNMVLSVITAMKIAEGLDANMSQLFHGLANHHSIEEENREKDDVADIVNIGILSLGNRRITCILDPDGAVIGTSELNGGLDLVETAGKLIKDIEEAINAALPNNGNKAINLKQAKLKLVTQSYEFENTRHKFIHFAERYFKEVILLSDWQLTYLSVFGEKPGISLIVDKGVSLSYQHNGIIKKLGGWKFPIYDFGGENWLGIETIRHTIRAVEGYCPMSELAKTVLSSFDGKIESIVENFFKGGLGADVSSTFSQFLLRAYFKKDPEAEKIIAHGATFIHESIKRVDEITGNKLNIVVQGSLVDIYKEKIEKNRLTNHVSTLHNVELLSKLTKKSLSKRGIFTE